MVASSSGIYLGSLQLSAGTTQLPQQSNPGRALASGLSRPQALFCGRQTWHRSHTPVTPDALFIHTPHGARTRPRSGRCTGDMWLHCACAIIFWRSTGSRKSPTRTAGSAHTDHGHGKPENVGGKHYREVGALGGGQGAHFSLGGWRGPRGTTSFPVYDSHAISGERRGHAKSRRPHHRPHRLQHCTHTDTARKNTSSGRVESSCYVGCSLVERVRDVWRELYSQRGAPRTHDSAGGTRGASHHRSSLLPSAGASSWSSCAGTAITGMAHGRSDSSRACGS